MILWVNGQFNYTDLILLPIYVLLIYILFNLFSPTEKKTKKLFITGLFLKIMGGVSFWWVYCQTYNGGDSWAYFVGSEVLGRLFFEDFSSAVSVISGKLEGREILKCFNSTIGYPPAYMTRDYHTFSVIRYCSLFTIIGLRSFLITTILISSFSYIGVWKFYKFINILYPKFKKQTFYIIICLPSLLFWGGGIMKDTFVLSSCCWLSYNFYMVLILRKKRIPNTILLFINLFIIINIKSYLAVSLIPGLLLWLNSAYLKRIKSKVLKFLAVPFISTSIFFGGYFIFSSLSSQMGDYGNVDSAINQAQIIQQDLLRDEAYGKNNYYLGEIDGTLSGMLVLAPAAIFTAIFRPLPWEVGSPTMIISAIENSVLLVFIVLLVIKISPITFVKMILRDPFILYAITFSLLFAFGVGVASTNFGALVRYKIPLMPYFFLSIYVIFKTSKIKNEN